MPYARPWVEDATPEDLASDFEGWEDEVQDIIKVRLARTCRRILLNHGGSVWTVRRSGL